jgi:excisionase family DNA binding protein
MGSAKAPERKHFEESPKNVAEFESWLKAARQRLQEVVDFGDALPGELDLQAYYDAADIVAQAGDFARSFPFALCRRREAMRPHDAIECIDKCLDWCKGSSAPDEPDLHAIGERLDRFEEGFMQVASNLALLTRQRTVKEAYTPKEVAELLGKKEYTVREWCRLGRIAAKKLPNGRGNEGEWRIPHKELMRYQTEGLLPLSPQARLR